MRPSGTEPVIRVTGEGDDRMLVEEVVDGIVDALNAVGGVSLRVLFAGAPAAIVNDS